MNVKRPSWPHVFLNAIGLTAICVVAGFERARAAGPATAGIRAQIGLSVELASGFLLAWFLLLAGFSLLIWLSQREAVGIYFLASQIFILILLTPYLQPAAVTTGTGSFVRQAGILWISLTVSLTILFIFSLTPVREYHLHLQRLAGPAAGLWLLFGLASFWLPVQLASGWVDGLLGVTGIYLGLQTVSSLINGYRPAVYATAGLVVGLIGLLVGLTPAGRLSAGLPVLTLMLVSFCFAAALYDRQQFQRAQLGRTCLELRETKTRLLGYLEALPLAAAVIGADQKLVWLNHQFVALFDPDRRSEGFPGSLEELFDTFPIYLAGTTEPYSLNRFPTRWAFKGESARSEDLELEREDGRVPLIVWAEPLLDIRSRQAGVLLLCQDISDRRQHEQGLERHIQELQLLVDLRLEELRYEHEDRLKVEGILHRLATTDPLTGLLNRRHWMSMADRYMKQSARYQHPLSLLLVDIDHFNFVNEVYNQQVGDETLIRIATTMQETVRNVDLLGRYGDDEFIILLPDTDQRGAEVLAERLRSRVADLLMEYDQGPVLVTLSIGVTEIFAGQNLTLEQYIERADLALYGAKHSGRNRVMAYEPMGVN